MTLVLTGTRIEEKAAWASEQLTELLAAGGRFGELDMQLLRFDHPTRPRTRRRPPTCGSPSRTRPAQGRPRPSPTPRWSSRSAATRLPHHHPALGRERLRRVLAHPGARLRGGAPGSRCPTAPRHRCRTARSPPGSPSRPSRRAGTRGGAHPAAAAGRDRGGPLRRQGRQREHRALDPHRRRVRVAARPPHRRARPGAAAGGRRAGDPPLRPAEPARAEHRRGRDPGAGVRLRHPPRPAGQGAGRVPAQPPRRHPRRPAARLTGAAAPRRVRGTSRAARAVQLAAARAGSASTISIRLGPCIPRRFGSARTRRRSAPR
ncbi:hypothetical protein L7F22_063544 [Adiantum nelumboides]|nr:hypothetical protein [Adiantum nelumboides]